MTEITPEDLRVKAERMEPAVSIFVPDSDPHYISHEEERQMETEERERLEGTLENLEASVQNRGGPTVSDPNRPCCKPPVTDSEFDMLYGLSFAGRAYISASEHNSALSLCERGFAKAATYADGMHMWMITDKGKEAVDQYRQAVPDYAEPGFSR